MLTQERVGWLFFCGTVVAPTSTQRYCCVVLPGFENGLLPPGIYLASWEVICVTFGWNPWRRRLLEGLDLARRDLHRAGCRRVWLDGSFVTTKEIPGDYDLTWDTDGVDVALLSPVLRNVRPPRWAQKAKYLGDILPNVVEAASGRPFLDFFQEDAETGAVKGIVEMSLEEVA